MHKKIKQKADPDMQAHSNHKTYRSMSICLRTFPPHTHVLLPHVATHSPFTWRKDIRSSGKGKKKMKNGKEIARTES